MAAAATAMDGDRLLVTRDLRVACGEGEDCHVVDVKRGEPWPADGLARIDVLIRVGHVVRFDENGVPDKRSRPYLRRLGMQAPPRYQTRKFHERARAEEQKVEIAGERVRVLAGRPDGDLGDLFVVSGRAYVLRRGIPDGPTAAGAPSAPKGGAIKAPRRRPTTANESTKGKRRRRAPRG